MIVVGVLAAAVLTVPGLLARGRRGAADPGCRSCSTAPTASSRAGASSSRPPASTSTASRHYLTETLLPIALGIRADGGWDSIGGYTTLGLVAAVLALMVRTERRWSPWRARRPGKPAAEDTAAVAAPRAVGARAGAARCSATSRSSARSWRSRRRCWRWRRRSATRSPATCVHARARDRARADRGHHRGRAPGGDPHLEPPAVSVRLRRCSRWAGGRTDLRRALGSLLAQEGVETDVVVVGNTWEPTGLPDGVRGVALARERRHPGGAQPRRAGGAAASCCSSSTTTPRWRRPTRWPRVARRFADDPALGLLQLRVEPREPGGARSRDWVPRLRVGDPARSSDVTAVWEGAVAIRRAVFEAVGGWPGDFQLRPRGHRPRMAGDGRRATGSPTPARSWRCTRRRPARRTATPSTTAPATGCGWPAATSRCRWRSSYVANFALRTLPRLRSAANAREALRGLSRRAARAGRRAQAAEGAHVVADDPRRSTPDHVTLLA